MLTEITTAAEFLSRYLMLHQSSKDSVSQFKSHLIESLLAKYSCHWDLQCPHKGSAFRSLSNLAGNLDPVIVSSLLSALPSRESIAPVARLFPLDLVLWIDPFCVSYRIGDYGHVSTIYESHASQDPSLQPSQRGPAVAAAASPLASSNHGANAPNNRLFIPAQRERRTPVLKNPRSFAPHVQSPLAFVQPRSANDSPVESNERSSLVVAN
ncbi:uncharacterized protein BJ171DRAFT_476376 [Polychytrium aggregatum]|uniref:uncharacterized protein n=1 Tax=Polychytrium aggregatum TaxID=110093 RepID=UPI0022FDFA8C|nr:uncharacterized protein BJ171DRAFT_476376 [Polychytrium aggregatum]KAI9202897.1 hypothetical protein BJ171DRAFT_476376 [Polychytrium aggregatum]